MANTHLIHDSINRKHLNVSGGANGLHKQSLKLGGKRTITRYGNTPSEIMKRAWALYRGEYSHMSFRYCLTKAWRQAQTGRDWFLSQAPNSASLPSLAATEADKLHAQITSLEMTTRLGVHGMKKLDALYRRRRELSQAA